MEIAFDQKLGIYRHENLAVSPVLTEDLLVHSYLQLKQEGTLETIYYEGVPSLGEYLQRATAPQTIVQGAFTFDSNDLSKPATFRGLSWVYDRQRMGNGMTKAELGFAFFRHSGTSCEKVKLGKMMVESLFGHYPIDVLIGTTPEENRLACRYSENVGFELHGPIPNYVSWEGMLTGVWVSVLTRTEWYEKQKAENQLTLVAKGA